MFWTILDVVRVYLVELQIFYRYICIIKGFSEHIFILLVCFFDILYRNLKIQVLSNIFRTFVRLYMFIYRDDMKWRFAEIESVFSVMDFFLKQMLG